MQQTEQTPKRNGGRGNLLLLLAAIYLLYLGGQQLWNCYRHLTDQPVLAAVSGVIFLGLGGYFAVREGKPYLRSFTANKPLPDGVEDEEENEDVPALPEEEDSRE